MGCATPVGVPVGNFESATRSPGSVRLTGWAIDPDTANPTTVHVYVDGGWGGAYSASGNRPDLGSAFSDYGANHGFDTTVTIRGTHQICVYTINVGPAATNPLLGCRTVSGTPTGNFESATRSPGSVRLTGWALDPDTANPATVHVYVDGGWGGTYSASGNRGDVATAFPGYGANHGFDTTVPIASGTHQICVYAINVGPAATNPLLGCRTVSGTPTGNFESVTRTGNSLRLTGWALDPDTANPATVHVYVDGGWGGAYSASGNRGDIAAAFPGYGANHGSTRPSASRAAPTRSASTPSTSVPRQPTRCSDAAPPEHRRAGPMAGSRRGRVGRVTGDDIDQPGVGAHHRHGGSDHGGAGDPQLRAGACARRARCVVTLASPQPVEAVPPPGVSTASFAGRSELQALTAGHDVVVGISGLLAEHPWPSTGKVIVADAYDPVLLEVLEWFAAAPAAERNARAATPCSG